MCRCRTAYAYYEVTELENLDATLQTIIWAGVAAALLTSLLGAALGWWAASRVLRPLNDVAQAATRLASGDLERAGTDDDRPRPDRDLQLVQRDGRDAGHADPA